MSKGLRRRPAHPIVALVGAAAAHSGELGPAGVEHE